jgi:hypothetical protein
MEEMVLEEAPMSVLWWMATEETIHAEETGCTGGRPHEGWVAMRQHPACSRVVVGGGWPGAYRQGRVAAL